MCAAPHAARLTQGFLFQCLAGRIGLVSGKDLAQHLGERYPKPARIGMWIIIEIAIIGADIQVHKLPPPHSRCTAAFPS